MGWFLLRRFLDLVRVYSLQIISRNHSNTFLLLDLQNTCRQLSLKFVQCFSWNLFLFLWINLLYSITDGVHCLMSKFTEMLMLVCKKKNVCFLSDLHESFSNSYGFAYLQKFNILISSPSTL